eukprot:252875-Rhodomonas_salina.1
MTARVAATRSTYPESVPHGYDPMRSTIIQSQYRFIVTARVSTARDMRLRVASYPEACSAIDPSQYHWGYVPTRSGAAAYLTQYARAEYAW